MADATENGEFLFELVPGMGRTARFNFGKHRGELLVHVADRDNQYLHWMLWPQHDFTEEVRALVQAALVLPPAAVPIAA